MSINPGPTKWYCLSTALDNFDPQPLWQFCEIKPAQSWFYKKYKKTEPVCKASISSRTQRQLPFSQSHFVGFSPVLHRHSSFSEVEGNCFMQLLQHENVDIFLPAMSWQSFCTWKLFALEVTKTVPKQRKGCSSEELRWAVAPFVVAWHLSCSAQQQEHQSQPARNVRRAPNTWRLFLVEGKF